MSSTLPMAAIFTRNKMIGWTSVLFAINSWLSETPSQRSTSATPAYFSVGMALMAVGVVSTSWPSIPLLRSLLISDIGVYAPIPASASSEGWDWDWRSGCSWCVVELGKERLLYKSKPIA